MKAAQRIDERGLHAGGSQRSHERKPAIKVEWCSTPTREEPDEDGKIYLVGTEINVSVAAWDINRILKVGDCVYLSGAGPLKAARLGKIESFHEELNATPENVGLWMQLRTLCRPEHIENIDDDMPDDLELHAREVFLHQGEPINAHSRVLELQAQPKVTELHDVGALDDAPHNYFYRCTYLEADPPERRKATYVHLQPPQRAPPTPADAGGAAPMETDEAEPGPTTEPATAKPPRRTAAKEVDALKARVEMLENKERAQQGEIQELRSQVAVLLELVGRVTELENGGL